MKILMGLSGGVDSCFASRLLSEAGHAVEGAFLRMTAEADAKPAERAAAELGIPLHILDCRELFEEHVLKPFTESYMQGRTPNPCVECNRYVILRHKMALTGWPPVTTDGSDRERTGGILCGGRRTKKRIRAICSGG